MALANDPEIIITDEPTGNLDSVSAQKILDLFQEFNKKNPKKAIIIVTHNPIFQKIADRTLILRDGAIVEEIPKDNTYQKKFEGIQ